jgi:hypothetical protein
MKKIYVTLAVILLFLTVDSDTKKQKNVSPDKPIVTTWSKIKSLFE